MFHGSEERLRARQALLHEIIANGIVHGTQEQPIISRDGRKGTSWVMSFPGVGLREPWLSMASDLILSTLQNYQAQQIATMGIAASSILAGCVLRSSRRYNALIVRSERKPYGSAKQIDGLSDKTQPVVVIDDAIGTGYSALKCVDILEAHGFEVEGVVCLVRFSYDSGYGLLEEHGLKVRAVYDLYDDFTPVMQPEDVPVHPWRARNIAWRNNSAPEGLSPFALVRLYLQEFEDYGALSKLPKQLVTTFSSPGGCWVSLRHRNSGLPVARTGVWCFPGDPEMSFTTLLAEATWNLSCLLKQHKIDPTGCGIGISQIGQLEQCLQGDADNNCYGLVCRSTEREWQVGSALPRMPGITGSSHQLRHALFINGKFRAREPFIVYRHKVDKLVEAGALWPTGGCSTNTSDLSVCTDLERTANILLSRAIALIRGAEIEPDQTLFLSDRNTCFLTIYHRDTQCACGGRRCVSVAEFDALVHAVTQDQRLEGIPATQVVLQLSILSDCWSSADIPEFVAGKDALGLVSATSESILLPGVAVEQNLDSEEFAAVLFEKSAVDSDTNISWQRFNTRQWLRDTEGNVHRCHPSIWVATRQCDPYDLETVAQYWLAWLQGHISTRTLVESEQPVQQQTGNVASAAVYAEAIRRIGECTAALHEPAMAIPFDLLPRDPDLLTLAHAYGATNAGDKSVPDTRLFQQLISKLDTTAPRHQPIAWWRAIEAAQIDDERVVRWQNAPLSPYERIVRCCAKPNAQDLKWIRGLIGSDGSVVCSETNIEDCLVTARTAEALAGSIERTDQELAQRILLRLVQLSVLLDDRRAAIRASDLQTGLRAEHTIAALAAFARLHQHNSL
ncbi:hypothetical protein AB833_14860 [Chromatiales bacterium (ex Bugula neritina AB1)]|nr:hypothetical protein AB833_14860 [Chromatiales bacterium (ex Bugula neritina AB1)]